MEFKKNVSFVPHSPPLEEVVEILHKGLKDYFETVDVSLVDSPKFNEKPYCLSLSGLHGKPTIADVGGVHNLIPHVNFESKYNLQLVSESIYKDNSDYPISAFGPGGGPYQKYGWCSEFMGSASYDVKDDKITMVGCSCRYCFVNDEGKGVLGQQPDDDRFGLMGNFYLSQNKPGRVLKIHVKKRISKENFPDSIRAVLLAAYGDQKPISMGGVFLINSGTAKLHIMPKYWPEEPSTPDSVNNNWLKYYNITKHPLVCLSVFHSHDPGFGLRIEHTHCFNLDTPDEAGHYHYDVTPETVEYEGYFNTAERVYKLDELAHKK